MLLSYVQSSGYSLVENGQDKPSYLHAICEQAIHLLQFDKERYRLQSEGVKAYRVDDLNFDMNNALISSVALSFIKSITRKQVGRII